MSALKRMTNVEANSSLGQAFAIKITAWKIWHINYVYTEWSNDDAHFYKKKRFRLLARYLKLLRKFQDIFPVQTTNILPV